MSLSIEGNANSLSFAPRNSPVSQRLENRQGGLENRFDAISKRLENIQEHPEISGEKLSQHLENRLEKVGNRIDNIAQRIDHRQDTFTPENVPNSQRLENLQGRVENRFDAISERLENSEISEEGLEQLQAKVDAFGNRLENIFDRREQRALERGNEDLASQIETRSGNFSDKIDAIQEQITQQLESYYGSTPDLLGEPDQVEADSDIEVDVLA